MKKNAQNFLSGDLTSKMFPYLGSLDIEKKTPVSTARAPPQILSNNDVTVILRPTNFPVLNWILGNRET
jgi:hypothetical protein